MTPKRREAEHLHRTGARVYSRLQESARPRHDLIFTVEKQGGKKPLERQTLNSRVENGGWVAETRRCE